MYFVVSEGGSGSFVMALDKPGNPDGGRTYLEIDSPTVGAQGVELQLRDDNKGDCTSTMAHVAYFRLTCLTVLPPLFLTSAPQCVPGGRDCYAWDSTAGSGTFSWCVLARIHSGCCVG